MKRVKFTLMLFLFSILVMNSQAQKDITADFTDPNFKAEVYRLIRKSASQPIYDTDVSGIAKLHVAMSGILSMNGIEHFTGLQSLNCELNRLRSLNVSNLTNLQELICEGVELTTLDVSNLINLQELRCDNNQLTTLDVSNLKKLRKLSCHHNKLTSLNVSNLTNLEVLVFYINQLTTLDVSELTNLKTIACHSNRLTTLDLSKSTSLQYLLCEDNQLTTLDVSKLTNLQHLHCEANRLTTLDVSNLTNLQEFVCYRNQLTALDVSNLADLRNLICNNNNLTTLDISKLNQLIMLNCSENYLTAAPTGYNPLTTTSYQFDPQKTAAVTGISLNKTTVSLLADSTEQLIASILPLYATNKNVNWSSSNTSIATVNSSGLITAKLPGTATITATAKDGGFSATCSVSVQKNQTVVVDEGKPAGANGTGTIEVSLEILSNTSFTGTFNLTLPNGMSIDLSSIQLVDGLKTKLSLSITQTSKNTWLFTITPASLRSITEMSYQKIMDIVYKVEESVSDGAYKASINNLNFVFDNGTSITKSEIPISIRVDHSYTGISDVSTEEKAYISGNTLYVNSPVEETINLYSVSGTLLYRTKKPAGEIQIPLNDTHDKILIIRGSSGWVKKEVKK